MLRPRSLVAHLLGLSLLAAGCTSGPPAGDDTDETSVEPGDTDLADTDAVDTDVADTDLVDTDVLDTDVLDTDVACPDSDHDGVCDADDLCVGDDAYGDLDADQICDNTDLCAGDNSTGDADGDGVCGNLDQCFGGDASGDSDADGTCDDVDQCVGVDATGDSDLDGVCDDRDLCNGDDATGDADSDGICGDLDVCPLGDDNVDLDSDGYPDACEPVELGRVHIDFGSYGRTTGHYAYGAFTIQANASCPSASAGDTALGQSVALAPGDSGTYSFDANDGYDFTALVGCLTDGVDQGHLFWAGFSDGPNQAVAAVGSTRLESTIGGAPDFAGDVILRIDMHPTLLEVSDNGTGGTSGHSAVDWVFYGYTLP